MSRIIACWLVNLLVATAGCLAPAARAQEYPSRPVRIVVSYAPGGASDIGARTIADGLRLRLQQSVIVENRPGADGLLGAQAVLTAPSDGYSILFQAVALLTPTFSRQVHFDVQNDFFALSPIWETNNLFVINAAVPAKDMAEFVAYAKKNPGVLNYGIPFSTAFLFMERLKGLAGIDMVGVRYKGSAPATTAMVANEIQAGFDALATYAPHIRSGSVRPLMFSSDRRHPDLPNVPTAAEAGFPDLAISLTLGLWARSGTPPIVAARIGEATNDVLKQKQVQDTFTKLGVRPVLGSGADLAQRVGREIRLLTNAAKAANFTPEN